jgi:hypothetical protein
MPAARPGRPPARMGHLTNSGRITVHSLGRPDPGVTFSPAQGRTCTATGGWTAVMAETFRRARFLRGLVMTAVLASTLSVVHPPAADAAGDATYQFFWRAMGCTLTVTDSNGIYEGANVTGTVKLVAQAVNGGNKIGRIRVDWALVVPDDTGLWVRQDGYRGEAATYKDRTSPVTSTWPFNRTFTDVSKPVYQARVIFKISWRKWYGVFGAGFWKTKKKTADLYPTSVVSNLSGNFFLSDMKNWVWGPTCRVRHQ